MITITTLCRKFTTLSKYCHQTTSIRMLLGLESVCMYKIQHIHQTKLLCEKSSEQIDAINAALEKSEKSRTPEPPKISLMDPNNNISVTTIAQAEKIARNNNLRLVQINDPTLRSRRPVYQLMTEAQFLNEELKAKTLAKEEKKEKSTFSKGEKIMAISSRISANDLDMKIRKAVKDVKKRFEVRVIISGATDNTTLQESVYNAFEEALKREDNVGRIVQKRAKGGDLRFQIIPPKEEKTKESKKRSQPAKLAVGESKEDASNAGESASGV